jgi:AcrB/AcrD/AcrF family
VRRKESRRALAKAHPIIISVKAFTSIAHGRFDRGPAAHDLAPWASLPIAAGFGAGASLRQPLGVAVVAGLIVSQALTLFTIPVTYIYMDRLSDWLTGRCRRRPVDIARDHALVPADNHPAPAVINRHVAE